MGPTDVPLTRKTVIPLHYIPCPMTLVSSRAEQCLRSGTPLFDLQRVSSQDASTTHRQHRCGTVDAQQALDASEANRVTRQCA